MYSEIEGTTKRGGERLNKVNYGSMVGPGRTAFPKSRPAALSSSNNKTESTPNLLLFSLVPWVVVGILVLSSTQRHLVKSGKNKASPSSLLNIHN
jgi:hypothetical protein